MTFRVIDKKTGKEADPYEIALREEWAKQLCYCDMDGFAILEDGTLLLVDECGKFEYCDTDRFEVVFDNERPHGEWIVTGRKNVFGGFEIKCSNCHNTLMVSPDRWEFGEKFCDICGSRNKKEGDAECMNVQ